MARYALNMAVQQRYPMPFPIGTVVVNVIGCLVAGLLAGLVVSGRGGMSELTRTFLFVGILGGFTTFSAFGLETFVLARAGQPALAAINAAGQLFLGLGMVWVGFTVGSFRF